MKITIVAVGKLKDAPWRELAAHYQRLAGRYAPLEVSEVRDERLGAKRLTGAAKEQVLAKESERLLSRIPKTAHVIALDRAGRSRDSKELARWLGERAHEGRELNFVIGGALGLAQAVTDRAQERLCLGPLTLPHQMARVVLLEQLYRAWTILRGETYHY